MEPIFLYSDNIGKVEYVQHMGEDITIVNSARVSFGVYNTKSDVDALVAALKKVNDLFS